MQPPSLEHAWKDPLDSNAAIIPQFELNAYDALNALTMDCDAFVEGDLLVTFPQCKDAEGCPWLSPIGWLDSIKAPCYHMFRFKA